MGEGAGDFGSVLSTMTGFYGNTNNHGLYAVLWLAKMANMTFRKITPPPNEKLIAVFLLNVLWDQAIL